MPYNGSHTPMIFPDTPINLITRLKESDGSQQWQVSWKRFLELYHAPIEAVARACYRHHTGGHSPSSGFVEDAVANTVADFFSCGQHRYDAAKARLRGYLRVLTNARVVDLLRKERPLDQQPLDTAGDAPPEESQAEQAAFRTALLATLIEDLRHLIPLRQFEIFERVKLKHQTPEFVAEEFGIPRAMVDRQIHRAMTRLREIASHPAYQQEFYPP
jgi:RNA polymerase sigma factor (sigma-70 family)